MKIPVFVFLAMFSFSAHAQKESDVWIVGYHYGFGWPVSAIDFYNSTPDTFGCYTPINFFGTDASICDSSGHLQFYTNGVYMMNKYHQYMQGADSFNHEGVINLGFDDFWDPQGVIILPYPGHPDQYCIFHVNGVQFNNNLYLQPIKIEYSIVDMKANAGEGAMTIVNQVAMVDTVLYRSMQAVKHANGRDWWIINHGWKSDEFDLILLTPDGISLTKKISVGPWIDNGIFIWQSVFSPDGFMFAFNVENSNSVYLFDFDRCSGSLSLHATIHMDDSLYFILGCAFSPSSRFLYITDPIHLYQFDMYADSISQSKILVGEYDGFGDPFSTIFTSQSLAPDGKIYITSYDATKHYHVINNPDESGTGCNFQQHGLALPSYQGGVIPQFPNYSLSSLAGSVCDTLTSNIGTVMSDQSFEIFPIPAHDYIFIRCINKGNAKSSLSIFDLSGKCVLPSSEFNMETIPIEITSLPNAVYRLEIRSDGTVQSKLFVKQ